MTHKSQLVIQLTILVSFIHFSSQQQCPTSQCDCVTTSGQLQISCRDKQLTVIPTFIDNGITYDEITFGSSHETGCSQSSCSNMNRISTVPANAFANLRVKKIVLTQNAIGTYDSNAFAGLEGILEDLELEGNGNNAFPNDAIRGLTNLTVLYLEHFSEQTMTQSNTLSPLPKLTQLTFKKINNLNNIQYNAFYIGPEQSKSPKFPLLSTFHLKDVPSLTAIPVAAIQELTGLTELDISGTGITRVYPQTFSPFYKLVNLHITYNTYLTIVDIGAFDGIYDTLEFLFLGHNQLSSLTSLSANRWQKLTQLNLQYNGNLRTVQASDFSTLGSKLRYLNLDSCGLTSIQSSMFNTLTGLHTLVLSNNEIQSVPDSVFQSMQELTELRLDKQTNAMTLNENSFRGIETSLNHLIIHTNTIDKPTFWQLIEKLPNLLELNAGKLNLQTIPDKAFKNNGKITILDLESNGITSLQEGSFYRLRDSLEVLTLSFNSLSTFSKCVLNGFSRLRQIHLSGNPLDCDCSLRWLRDWVWAQPDRFLAGGLVGPCTSPSALATRLLSELNSNNLTCDPGYVEPTCTDLYATTTTSTTTTTAAPKNIVNIVYGQITHTSVTVMWTISNKESALTGLVFQVRGTSRPDKSLHRDTVSETVNNLEPNTSYTFCLKLEINNVVDEQYTKCRVTETVPLNIPTISLSFGQITETSINIIWHVSDRTDVSGYVLNINKGNVPFRTDQLVDKGKDQDTILGLEPNTYYTFCMYFKLHEVDYPQYEDCETEKTKETQVNTTAVPTTPKPDSNIGIIVGAVVGVVVLIGVIIVIIIILVCVRKPPKKPPPAAMPVSFIPQPTGSLPSQGGTAKRFSKPKDGKDGAVGVDDVKIQTISNGGFDNDRFSAGSYQLLHEKDFHRPGSAASTSTGGATPHYVNDLSVDRPLPRTPYGVPDSKMGKRGYVNTGFQGSADPLPQSSNTYSEIDPSKEGRRGERSEKVTII